jgi:DNA-binding LacI/PurR family transcriptional regulator
MVERKIRNMEEFAAVSGISRPTVSKYFNDPRSVRPSTRERIEAALERYDYHPNIYAMNQNRRLTKMVGIMVPNIADPFFAEIAHKIERLCIDAGFRPILLSSHGDPDTESENLDALRSLRPAGVLLAPLGRTSDRAAVEKFCAEVPTVLFDGQIEGIQQTFIGSDNMQSIGLIVDYLCRTGEPPCFLEMRTPSNPNAQRRRRAYEHAMTALGHASQIIQIDGEGWAFEAIGYREGLRVLAERKLSTDTVLCSNDRLAIGFLAAAYESGLRVGRGSGCALRVAGHDDHPIAGFTCPRLTTVAQDYQSITELVVRTLCSLIENGADEEAGEITLFESKLVMRESA